MKQVARDACTPFSSKRSAIVVFSFTTILSFFDDFCFKDIWFLLFFLRAMVFGCIRLVSLRLAGWDGVGMDGMGWGFLKRARSFISFVSSFPLDQLERGERWVMGQGAM